MEYRLRPVSYTHLDVYKRQVLTALRLEHRQVGLELVPLPAQVLVLVAPVLALAVPVQAVLEPVLPVPVAPVQVVLIPACLLYTSHLA